MKKLLYLVGLCLLLINCSEEIEFNSPAFQANEEETGNLWRAATFYASIDDLTNYLTISGTAANGSTITITIPTVALGTYPLGNVDSMRASYTTTGGTYATTNTPDPSVQLYPADGEVILEDIDYLNRTFYGTFWFDAFDATGLNNKNFHKGIFYKVPLTTGNFPSNVYTCQDAQAATAIALQAYTTVDIMDSAAYETACQTYKSALVNEMNYCADEDGSIQEIINQLDAVNCQLTCEQAMANTETVFNDFDTATLGNYIAACNRYVFYLNEQITFCGDDDGAIQALIDEQNCEDTDADGVADVLEDLNQDDDFTNDDTDTDLNPNYVDDDDDDDGILTADELNLDTDGNPADTDGDGIPDYLDSDEDGDGVTNEDINGDGDPTNDDTDGDGIPNYLDNDDDGDSILTIFEDLNGNGNLGDDDTDADGTPNYLDVDDDGDTVHTMYEVPDPDADGNPNDAQDFDADGIPDYLDNDDDNDGILTADENPDPNGDGNPDDAQNSDADQFPDYLDAV